MARVLVLGAGFAGVNTSLSLMGSEHDVKLLDMKGHHEYIPGLVDLYRERREEKELMVDLNDLFRETEVAFSREKVEMIYPDSRKVETNAGMHEYDKLVIGLGAEPRNYGMDLEHTESPYSLDSTRRIIEELGDAEETAIIGSGYVGVEIAGEIHQMTDVKVIDGSTRPMPNSNEKSGHIALDYFNDRGITFMGGKRAKSIEEDKIVLEEGSTVRSDLAIWAGGLRAKEVVRESFDCGPEGICVDSTLRSEQFPEVFVLGDSADIGCKKTAHNAMRQADVAATNLCSSKSDMVDYESSAYPLMVSLGRTGMMVYGNRAFRNRSFRTAKDLVFRGYRTALKAKKVKSNLL